MFLSLPVETTRVAPRCTVRSCQGREPLDRSFALDWERLASTLDQGTVFGSPLWLSCWWRRFGRPERTLALHGLHDAADNLVGVFPLVREGHVLRRWVAPRNLQAPMVDMTLQPACHEAVGALLDSLGRTADVLELTGIPKDGAAWATITGVAEARGLKCLMTDTTPMSLITLTGGWESFRAGLPQKLVYNTERAKRQLEKLGSLVFEEHRSLEGLPPLLRECFDLEAASWKGAQGTAISSDTATEGFYIELASEAARASRLRLYTLRLDGRLIAFDLCLRWAQWIHLLKIGYEPGLSRYSPGQVLRYSFLERQFQAPEARWYDLGPRSEWKSRWTDAALPLSRVLVYLGHPRSDLAYLLGPALRSSLKKVAMFRRSLTSVRRFRQERRETRRSALKRGIRDREIGQEAPDLAQKRG